MDNIRIERIKTMEQHLDIAKKAIIDLECAIENFKAAQSNIAALAEYYHSRNWVEDYTADNNGKIPDNLKRGVLSEDGVYNTLTDNDTLVELLKNYK
ncbi:MAG: DUF4298 domain-containing protein [Ruminococcaceae bacterium]|nr:DUF4298 domain-containing protein [Oscillospiraceae bacterium]